MTPVVSTCGLSAGPRPTTHGHVTLPLAALALSLTEHVYTKQCIETFALRLLLGTWKKTACHHQSLARLTVRGRMPSMAAFL